MPKIIISIILFVVAYAVMEASMAARSKYSSDLPGGAVVGMALMLGMLILFIAGIKEFFYSDLLIELRKISRSVAHPESEGSSAESKSPNETKS